MTSARSWIGNGCSSKWQPVRVHRCLLLEITLETGRQIVHREPGKYILTKNTYSGRCGKPDLHIALPGMALGGVVNTA